MTPTKRQPRFIGTAAVVLLCVAPLASLGFAADDIPKDRIAAAAYFEALVSADAEKADALVAVPFSLDRKSILQTVDEVKAVHRSIAEKKGKCAVPKYAIATTDKASPLDATVFPKYAAFRVIIDGGEHADIYVSTDAMPKVIGFSD